MSRLDGHPEAERLRGDQSRRADGTGEEDRFMVNVNPPEKKHGLIVLENEVGHQQWALIVDAEVEYDNDVSISSSDAAQYSVTTTLAPGEMLRMASTFNPDEENVLVYSRLLVSVLREERERYAELEKQVWHLRRELARLQESEVSFREERFRAMEVGSRAFPPEGTEYIYAVKSEARFVGEPWAVIYKVDRPTTWHDDEWMAAQGFVPEGGW